MSYTATSDYLRMKEANCKNCYKCIRSCPVKSIAFDGKQAQILPEDCILCGKCFVVCPQKAKDTRDDVPLAKALLAGSEPVFVSLAPSFIANQPKVTFKGISYALQQLGFAGVEETAVGATQIQAEYERLLEETTEKAVYISTCCHTVNVLVEKYFPELTGHLAPFLSPMQTHALQIKAAYPQAKVVFIGPCISKKEEADYYPDIVDCVLTFEELAQWLQEEKIPIPEEQDDAAEGKARLFPIPGGILKSMDCEAQGYTYLAIDGVDECIKALQEIQRGDLQGCFIEMSACVGSCVGGPSMNRLCTTPLAARQAVEHFAGKSHLAIAELAPEQVRKSFSQRRPDPEPVDEQTITEILKKMGKLKPEDELNCSSCGYDSCRGKAKAVARGKADLSMCLPFLKERAEKLSLHLMDSSPNGLLLLNEHLEIQELNRTFLHLFHLTKQEDYIGQHIVKLLDPTPFYDMLESGEVFLEQRVTFPEIELTAIQTMVYDPDFHVFLALFRDISQDVAIEREKLDTGLRTIALADKVIQKQMRTVQEIALLLGETTAETKTVLSQIKDVVSHE